MKCQLGLMGLGTMGSALVENLASKGVTVSVWNRTQEKAEAFVKAHPDLNLHLATDFEDFLESLEKPRRILVIVPAGDATKEVLAKLKGSLEEGDTIMDGSNAHFRDTEAQQSEFLKAGLHILGCGVSGGEEGARLGPSMMPGGTTYVWELWQPLLEKIAAKDFEGKPCIAYMGRGGAGHYVKMVHNGIEYAEMEVLAEAVDLAHRGAGLSYAEIADAMQAWNQGPLASFLVEICIDVLRKTENGVPLLDLILDQAGQKGTGKWTTEEALNLGVSTPSLGVAVFMRGLSENAKNRQARAKLLPIRANPVTAPSKPLELLESALLLVRLSHFEQGFELLRKADQVYEFNLNLAETSRIWQGGCIIRSELLKDIHAAQEQDAENLIDQPFAKAILEKGESALRTLITWGTQAGIPVLGLASALTHLDAIRSERMSANVIQGLRDRFGAHGYERVDQGGSFHSNW